MQKPVHLRRSTLTAKSESLCSRAGKCFLRPYEPNRLPNV